VESETIVINLAPDVSALLADNGVDLLTELRSRRPDVKRSPRPAELGPAEPGTKSVELIILASAGAAPLVAAAITHVIDALSRSRKGVVTSATISTKFSFLGMTVELTDRSGKDS